MFYTLWSAKCRNIAGKALSATCKVHVIFKPWLDLWFVIFCNKIKVWCLLFSRLLCVVLFSSILLISSAAFHDNASCLQWFLWGESVNMVWNMNYEHILWSVNMWNQRFLGSCCSLRSLLFHKFHYFTWLILGCLQCRPKPFLGNSCNFEGLFFCRSFCFHCLDSRSYLLFGSFWSLKRLLFCFIYSWTNILFCFSNFLLSIFNNFTNLLLHSSKEFNNLL